TFSCSAYLLRPKICQLEFLFYWGIYSWRIFIGKNTCRYSLQNKWFNFQKAFLRRGKANFSSSRPAKGLVGGIASNGRSAEFWEMTLVVKGACENID
ncbi:MAG: hypothetical protein JWM99_1187, partial [Verrucomicrobiales bacterium]|nr:hypothetical protein [Verrucomicrobiales bacterium]